MKLWRGLSMRVLLASIACGVIGLAAAMVVTRAVVRELVVRAFAPLAVGGFRTGELEACEASPATWTHVMPSGGRAFAYDASTLASQNPEAPPLDRGVYRALLEAEGPPMAADMHWPLRGGTFQIRVADTGPCAIVQTIVTPHAVRTHVVNALLAGAVVVVMLAAALGFGFVILPLTRRIERLRLTAEHVGDAARYAPYAPIEDDALGALGQSLDRAHARIREDAALLEQRKEDLRRHLADVTHDLRTPLASLRIAVEQAADATTDPAVAELLASALRDAVYLAGLTENLRMASRLREGWDPFAGEPQVDLKAAAERVASRARFFARRRGIALDVAVPDDPVLARCNAIAAEQALANVVENALAYGDRGGHVAVVLAREGERFVLTVVDDGPGVPPLELPRLGERTFRSDEARQRDPRGSGLGLAITSEVCARCGWELRFEAEAPRGLRVRIAGDVAR